MQDGRPTREPHAVTKLLSSSVLHEYEHSPIIVSGAQAGKSNTPLSSQPYTGLPISDPPPPILDYFTFVVSPDTFDHSGMDKDVPRQGRPSWVQDVGSQDVAPGEDRFITVEHGASSGSLQTGVIPTTPSSFMGTMAKTVPPSAITSRPQCHWYDICLLLPRLTAIVD
jgi:hypothetical protein